ncbi:TlpA disulfide reductase family protein [Polaribacter sp. PL03]|uniref:TlpA family protein disulfide reductase n=1 Tax=Polaribacter sp. PL03 TaxID=3088353 RepID=UPI0029D04B1F|nr:TlpA disulfide reductase family protein [Polaribacter sp. PL03]MDX6746922.1 TlpA disulfide reductase family protein [Polaribacter sp. PL03]
MKKLSILLLAIVAIVSCTKEHSKEYLSLSGKLENNKDSTITISNQKGPIKTITINTDGTFKDTLKVENASIYTFGTSRTKRAPIYLKNGFDIKLNGDADEFMSSFKFSGKGADNSNFMIAQIAVSQKIGDPTLILALEENDFKNKLESIKKRFDSILNSYDDIDSSLAAMANQQTTQMMVGFNQAYTKNRATAKGSPSPKFTDYTDFKGGEKSLDSFKGKFVYIDVWATWCGPCIQQIPFLKNLEKEYHGKNIEFISLSTDESRRSGGSWEAAEKKWRDFVKAKQLTGTQLWAGKDYSFQQEYQINAIPRFILIDPQGNIVDANAPRPSEPRLKEIFTSLGI